MSDRRVDYDGWIFDDSENAWRYKRGEPNVVEMLLPCGKVTQISAHRHDDVKRYSWIAAKRDCTTYVVTSYWSANVKQKDILLHALLNYQWIERDHINWDGLDNRDENIRDAAIVNRFNRRFKNGGVVKAKGSNTWVVRWKTLDGKRPSRCFPWKNDDVDQQASQHAAAVKFRKEMQDAIITQIVASRPSIVERITAVFPLPKLAGFSFRRLETSGAELRVRISIEKEKDAVSYKLSQFSHEDLVERGVLHESDFAMDQALVWYSTTSSRIRRSVWEKKNKKRQREEAEDDINDADNIDLNDE